MKTNDLLALAAASMLLGCGIQPSNGDDDDDSGDDDASGDDDLGDDDQAGDDDTIGDDDTTGDDDSTPHPDGPVLSNMEFWIDVPQGETDEMLNVSWDWTDPDGDMEGGSVTFGYVDAEGIGLMGDGPYEGEDATSGTYYLGYLPFGEDHGLPPGFEATFRAKMEDRAGHESEWLEAQFTIP